MEMLLLVSNPENETPRNVPPWGKMFSDGKWNTERAWGYWWSTDSELGVLFLSVKALIPL